MARQFWPSEDAVGQRFYFFGQEQPTEVVGVARDSKVNFIGGFDGYVRYRQLAP